MLINRLHLVVKCAKGISDSVYTRWKGPLRNDELTKELIDGYLAQCTIYDLILAMSFFKTSVERGSLSAKDQWGR